MVTAFPRMMQSAQDLSAINPALDSVLQFLVQERQAQRELVVKYREYAMGDQTARLTTSQLAQFPDGKDPDHVVNVCPVILNTIADRLRVEGITATIEDEAEKQRQPKAPPPVPDENGDMPEPEPPAEPEETQGDMLTKQIRQWWDASQMDMTSAHLHFSAGRDAEAYLIVEWDAQKQRPSWVLQTQDDGVNGGVDIAYDEGTKEPMYATKRWTIRDKHDPLEYKARLNVYYEDRVEKYVSDGFVGGATTGDWQPFDGDAFDDNGNLRDGLDPDAPHIEWWRDGEGMALGLPVIHFPVNSDGELTGRSDLADIVPSLCDQLNDASVSLRIAAKLNGFKVRYATGVDKENSVFETAPGSLMTTSEQTAVFGEFTETNLIQLIDAKDSILRDISTITSVPLPNINPTAQVAAEGTLQQQEAPLIAKVEKRQPVFGNRYEEAVRLALRAAAVFGDLSMSREQIDDLAINIQWKSAVIRNELVDAQRAKLWRENGVPEEIIWRDVLGMSREVIDEAQKMKEDGRDGQREHDLEMQALLGRQQMMSGLREQGAAARERRTATPGNGNEQAQASGLPEALRVGA